MFVMFENEHFAEQTEALIMNERQQDMIEFIGRKKRASVKALAAHFFVCEMTIRRDLKELERGGYIKRYNGGAVSIEDNAVLPVAARRLLNSKEKSILSKRAEKYLCDSLTVFIDSSTTCMHVISLLSEYKDIKIITNSVMNLLEAAKYHIPCILAGGDYYEPDMCTVGSETERLLRDINADIAFFSAMGISDDGIISDSDARQTAVRKAVMQNAAKKLFLLDGEKLGKKYPYTLCRAEDADDIIMIGSGPERTELF